MSLGLLQSASDPSFSARINKASHQQASFGLPESPKSSLLSQLCISVYTVHSCKLASMYVASHPLFGWREMQS